MKFRLLLVFLVALLACSLGLSIIDSGLPKQVLVIEQAMVSVVEVINSEYPEYPASGSYIGKGIILTAGHVSEDEGVTLVRFEDGTECEVLERYKHPDYDCGFLRIEPIDKPALPFDLVPAKRGEEIIVLGHPKGMLYNASMGVVTGRDDCEGFFGEVVLVIVDAVSHGGNSGSAVIDLDGEIRGVLVGGRRSRCGSLLHGYAANVQVADILKALDAAGLEI